MANERSLSTIRQHSIRRLSDAQLAAKLDRLNTQKHVVDAELLLCLSELERRRLYREQACASLFEFCVARLGYSEDVAYKRVGAARLMLKYPEIYELLAKGHIHLTGLMLLKPHLTAANRQDWLTAASGKSKRQIEKLIAARLPQPDVPATIRRLPERKAQPAVENDPKGRRPQGDVHSAPRDSLSPTASRTTSTEVPAVTAVRAEAPESKPSGMAQAAALVAMAQSGATQPGTTQPGTTQPGTTQLDTMELEGADASVAESRDVAQPSTTRSGTAPIVASSTKAASGVAQANAPNVKAASRIDPLSSQSYRVVFTASERLKQKLDRAGELLSHAIAPNDLPAIVERALDQLIEREERRRYGGQPRRKVAQHSMNDGVAATHEAETAPPLRGSSEPPPLSASRQSPQLSVPSDLCHAASSRGDSRHCAPSCGDSRKPVSYCDSRQSAVQERASRCETPECEVHEQELHAACQKHLADRTEAQDPDPNPGATAKPHSRYVPAAVRREVWTRDGGQCTFVDRAGRRCEQRHFLELDHRDAFAIGGSDTAENLRIRCHAHNALEAEKLFGRTRIESAIAYAQRERTG